MPRLICLIGLPGSGKSTWLKGKRNTGEINDDWHIVSLDDIILRWGEERGLTYDEAWTEAPMTDLNAILRQEREQAYRDGKNVVIDMTNMSLKSRRKNIGSCPDTYTREAVLFVIPDSLLNHRLKEREKREGKSIPEFVIDGMARSYNCPTKDEFPGGISYVRD